MDIAVFFLHKFLKMCKKVTFFYENCDHIPGKGCIFIRLDLPMSFECLRMIEAQSANLTLELMLLAVSAYMLVVITELCKGFIAVCAHVLGVAM